MKELNSYNEIRALSVLLAEMPKQVPYVLPPAGWERTFENNLLHHIREEQQVSDARITEGGTYPFDLPHGYFESFAERLYQRLQKEEAKVETASLSPVLAGLSKSEVQYEIPEGYFDGTAEKIKAGLHSAKSAQIIPLFTFKKIIRYGIAACLLTAVSVFVWKMRFSGMTHETNIVQTGLKMSDQELERSLAGIDDLSIMNYLDQTGMGLVQDDLESIQETNGLPMEEHYLDEEFLNDFMFRLEQESHSL